MGAEIGILLMIGLPILLFLILYAVRRDNILRGWQIYKESMRFLRERKGLLAIPFIAFAMLMGAFLVVIGCSFLLLIYAPGTPAYAGIIVLFIILGYINYFVRILSTAMITAGVYGAEQGDTTFQAFRHLQGDYPALAKFAALLYGFAILTSIIEGAARRFGGPVGGMVGRWTMNILRWAVAFITTFTVAAIVIENKYSIRDAVKRSVHVIKEMWVEVFLRDLVGLLFVGIVFLLIGVEAGILYLMYITIPPLQAGPAFAYLLFGGLATVFVTVLVFALIYYVISTVYIAKLYIYYLKMEAGQAGAGPAPWAAPGGVYSKARPDAARIAALERVENFFG